MASISDISKLFDEKVATIVDKVNKRIEANEERTEEAHRKVDNHEARLQALELKLANGSSSSGGFVPTKNNRFQLLQMGRT